MPSHDSHDAPASMNPMAGSAGDRIDQLTVQLTGSAADFLETAVEYARKNPVKSIAIAAATGFAAGFFIISVRNRSRNE